MGRNKFDISKEELNKKLNKNNFNKTRTAKDIGCSLTTLKSLLKHHDIIFIGKSGNPDIKSTICFNEKKLKEMFQNGEKIKNIAKHFECKEYLVRKRLIKEFGRKRYGFLKNIYKWHKINKKNLPSEYKII